VDSEPRELVVASNRLPVEVQRDERSRRMRNLRAHLREHDVHRWARTFLDRLDPQSETTPPDPASSATVTFPGSLRRPREDR